MIGPSTTKTQHKRVSADRRMARLALCFPALKCAPGVKPWRPRRLDAWAAEAAPEARSAAQFLLALWNGESAWECGPFDAIEALTLWDEKHRWAFLKWAAAPWRP